MGVTYHDRDLRVFTNPSPQEYAALKARLRVDTMRATLYNGMLAVWDAYYAQHSVIEAILGIPYRQAISFEIVDDRVFITYDIGDPRAEELVASVKKSRALCRILGEDFYVQVDSY